MSGRSGWLLAAALAATMAGCGESPAPSDSKPAAGPAQTVDSPAPGTPLPAPPPPPPPPPPQVGQAAKPEPAAKSPEPSVPPRKKAEVGAGKKGHYGFGGPVATPIEARFRTEERIVFEIQIPHALQLFKGIHDRPPKDHKEFMREIITENRIKLPELPAGQRYVYDPKSEQLMIEGGQ